MPAQPPKKLLSLQFIVLFFQAMCCNCYIAVYYCLEQWMVSLAITPNWRGLLLAVLAATVFVSRPSVTWYLQGKNKTRAMVVSILVSSAIMLLYPFITKEYAVCAILLLRILQGFALAIYSSCTVTLLVMSIPAGQSARGFALFSLTLLLPYAIIPAIGESLIQLTGGEAYLFAWMALLGVPALLALIPLLPAMNNAETEQPLEQKQQKRACMWKSLHPRSLGLVYLACFTFSLMTNQGIFFVKGLCQVIESVPAYFFTTYTTTIMVVRLLGNTLLDKLPRARVILICSLCLALSTTGMAFCHGMQLIFLSFCYGFAMALLYPLLAAVVCDRSSIEERGINSNLMMAAFDCSATFAPILGGLIIHAGFGYQGVFINASLCISLCALAMFFDGRIQKRLAR